MEKFIENESLKKFFQPPNIGELIKGTMIIKEKASLFLDLGSFGTGVIQGQEFIRAKSFLKDKEPGDEISAKITNIDNDQGYIELSLAEARKELDWIQTKEIKKTGESFLVKISKANKGGLMAEIGDILAFLPVSQLSPENYPRVEDGDQSKILQELQKFIGQEMKVKILTLDAKQKTIILSEKKAKLEKTKQALESYKIGDVVQGEITGVVDFGAFMKFLPSESLVKENPSAKEENSIEGLIHVSELDWQLIQDPRKVIKSGEKVKAKIIDISNGKVSLSLKALKQDPWEKVEKKYKKGETAKGEVVKFNPFGAFIKLSPEIQGLIHISEFEDQEKMQKALKIGKKYNFKILLVDPKEHRINLKLILEK
ncbi:MAG: S1 RNA-binding domain-containing protein [Candidatus Pacebacteria bacterium]|nr:S1 RNA-binding domain-containing protein [Candidatus Paceibacterota bacterium]